MRVLAYLHKTFLENLREWKVLSFALVFAPAFVFMMYGYYNAASSSYALLVLDGDRSREAPGPGAEVEVLLSALREAKHADGVPLFVVNEVRDLEAARARVRQRSADLLVEIPAGFAAAVRAFRDGQSSEPAHLVHHSDDKNLRGSMAMALSDYVLYTTLTEVTRARLPLAVSVQPVGSGRPLSEFDLYVPALLVLAIIMILFTAATSLIQEVDRGTLMRLSLSRLKLWELLAAVSANQVLLGLVALTLAYLAALSCGYRSEGSLVVLLVVGALTSLSVVAIAVITAALLRSMFELLTVGTFPFFILMFFSECMFPLPKLPVVQILGHTLYANDVLPTTLCVRAFQQVLNFGAGIRDVGFELVVIGLLTTLYFALGTWLFSRRHGRMSARRA
ncbi:MAG: ABC transporter permease [Pseudomonadota bacterium]